MNGDIALAAPRYVNVLLK